MAGHLGESIGYIAGIMLGSGAGSIATKGAKLGAKSGSFLTGTTMMYGSIYDEMKQAGFDGGDAARIALSASGIVSLTEGAALEWIGKGATSWIPKNIATGALKGSFKEGSKAPFYEFQKRYALNLLK